MDAASIIPEKDLKDEIESVPHSESLEKKDENEPITEEDLEVFQDFFEQLNIDDIDKDKKDDEESEEDKGDKTP